MHFQDAYHPNIYYFTIKKKKTKTVLCKFVSVSACFAWKSSIPCINSPVHNTRINTVNFINFQLGKGGIRSLPICLNRKNQHLFARFTTAFTSMICVSFNDSQGQKKMSLLETCAPSAVWIMHEKPAKALPWGQYYKCRMTFWVSWPP